MKKGKCLLCIRKSFILAAMIFPLLFFISCSHSANQEKSFPELVRHMTDRGILIDGVKPMLYEVAGADSGFAFRIGPREIAVYKYDLSRKKQKNRYDMVVASRVLYLSGKKYQAHINGSFVMIDHDTHPDKEKIISAFESF